ncbi:DUF4041 domain-containing protein [Marispirochaeta sp.]|uniref:DUF4041 domain-containing protein n=1 Tax=Marispirochaeta sp. TaxID=2038653 RepID=UPI0029C61ABF|nr:DUF4041 domain-containing protein [Marispirochaeta sp.]
MENAYFIAAILGVFVILLLIQLIKVSLKNKQYRKKYAPIIDIEEEAEKERIEKEKIEREIKELQESYKEKKIIYDRLLRQIALYEEEIELAEYGFYKPHFDFDASERYKDAITSCREKQKAMVKNKKAVYCTQQWTVDGSKSKGTTMTNRNIRLTSRAFNNECDALIANVSWNNILRYEERIIKAKETIDKMNESNKIYIDKQYLNLKIDELRLNHEYKEKKQKEKEEQAELRRQMREEAKLQQEIEEAEKEEQKYIKLLEKAKVEAEKAAGDKLEQLKAKMAMLEEELIAAHEKNERAKSMAQQTKAGHVYIISNIGSFGEHVYKIGMTRRLDPMDRVKELGDASVPFTFDVHAMIYADDAPGLEGILHSNFDQNRLNLVNNRKEFFAVNLEDIEKEVLKKIPDAEFVLTAEAREYRESEMIRKEKNDALEKEETLIPNSI